MSGVKTILTKAKNQLFLAISAATAIFADGTKALAEDFATHLDQDKFKADLDKHLESLNLATDLYPAQAEFELSEMIDGYEAEIKRLGEELASAVANNESVNAELDQLNAKVNLLTDKLANYQSALVEREADLEIAIKVNKTLAAEGEGMRIQRDSFKQQYEAAIADEGVQLAPLGSAEYVPPAGATDMEEEATDNPYIIAARTLKKLKAKSQ